MFTIFTSKCMQSSRNVCKARTKVLIGWCWCCHLIAKQKLWKRHLYQRQNSVTDDKSCCQSLFCAPYTHTHTLWYDISLWLFWINCKRLLLFVWCFLVLYPLATTKYMCCMHTSVSSFVTSLRSLLHTA